MGDTTGNTCHDGGKVKGCQEFNDSDQVTGRKGRRGTHGISQDTSQGVLPLGAVGTTRGSRASLRAVYHEIR